MYSFNCKCMYIRYILKDKSVFQDHDFFYSCHEFFMEKKLCLDLTNIFILNYLYMTFS